MKIDQKFSLCSIEKKVHDVSLANPTSVYLRRMYCKLRSIVQSELRHIVTTWWIKLAEETQVYADANKTHKLYNAIKYTYGPTTNTTTLVKSRDETRLIKDNEGISRRLAKHY